ncbi:hypothetical protein [uncultured Methanobrevibacter sp.]|uniref:hypothetical protein n=1 Tax=uncultured Methanobrevibacter sp. TaxID=253161 RepID=UPI0025D5350B|nr:hypothetical protein [uncultured Methanobrevibacter sp.]
MGDTGVKPVLTTWGYFTSEISIEHATNGDKCVKLTLTNNSEKYFSFRNSECIGKKVNWRVDLYAPDSVKLVIYYYTTTWITASSVIVPSGASTTTLSATIPSNATNIWYRVECGNLTTGDVIFTDNWRLFIE